ncbi:hypothetical protein SB773_34875, partial [Bacillus sp. SIMBA_074]|uniref:hypothetical protein n=1 Tax=Bacillus sp. SIMBA_074 TaxID=3085812 RepID=UPI00397DCA3F
EERFHRFEVVAASCGGVGGVQKLGQPDQSRNGMAGIQETDAIVRPESESPLAGDVTDAGQEVDIVELLRAACLLAG